MVEPKEAGVLGVGVVAIAAGVYNLVGFPYEQREGVLGQIVDLQQTYDWVLNTTVLNSAVLLLVGVALLLLVLDDD